MLRENFLKKYITKEKLGLEIGPLHKGICRKDNDYNILIWDIVSYEELLDRYSKNNISEVDKLEKIDIISSKSLKLALDDYSSNEFSKIKSSKECLDYIISSHNLEHFPNPIQFFKDASYVLKEGGVLTISIPIASRCFDCLVPLSTTGQMIDSYFSNSTKPTFGEAFDHKFSYAIFDKNKNKNMIGINDPIYHFKRADFRYRLNYESYINLLETYNKQPYMDVHIWQFNLASFLSIFNDLLECKIIENLEIIDYECHEIDFAVSIRKNSNIKEINKNPLNNRINLKKQSILSYKSDLFPNRIFKLKKYIFLLGIKILKKYLSKRYYLVIKKIFKKIIIK